MSNVDYNFDFINKNKITRFEMIEENGRSIVKYNCEIELSLQDNGKTLKIFLKNKKQEIIPTIEDLDDTVDYPIGFKFKYRDDILKISEISNSTIQACHNCVFNYCNFKITACFGGQRLDGDSIIFKKIEN